MTSRYIAHSKNAPNLDNDQQLQYTINSISSALSLTFQNILQHGHQDSSRGVYVGLAGIALLEHHLSKSAVLRTDHSYSSLVSAGDQVLLACMNSTISKSRKQVSPSYVSFLETDVGVATLVLLRLLESNGSSNQTPFFKGCEYCLGHLRAAVESVKNSKEDACEVLYGRAGLLYALLRIRNGLLKARASTSVSADATYLMALKDLTSDDVLRIVVDSMIDIGREGAADYAVRLKTNSDKPIPPLMWTWHGKRYLGAAHGLVEPYSGDLVRTFEWLVDLQDPAGNWPSKAPDGAVVEHKNDLVQWCHGATGMLMLLSRASLKRSGIILDETLLKKVNSAIRKGARIVYHHGLLTKGVGVCHGVAGSVYALLAASRVLDAHTTHNGPLIPLTDETSKQLRRAVHLAVLAADFEKLTKNGEMRNPDRPWSLYEGSAGMCCAWADVLRSLTGHDIGGVPGFDDL
ncbi:hypothetical protein C0993_005538 [Termitomyces sp. T159_Od127]|nr:hypothetical protein C0993_005538 [Termitomyces sp. T159_Od127]